MEKAKFTFKTKEGCYRLFILFVVLILVFSCAARYVQSDFGRLKIEQITIDARGAELTAELYYPAGTTSKDLYPGIVVTHGGGCTYETSRIWAEELARRNFVVLNVSAYGAGLSAQPAYDENDQGVEGLSGDHTAMGLLDAKAFLSSLAFVDSTRIGMTGHSMGSRRTGFAAVMDCGYLTLNDRLVNVLYEEFGQSFSEAEITKDANELAKAKLNADQLKHYETIAATVTEEYNNELQAICLIGGDGMVITPMQPVSVGGHEVMRNCRVNMGIVNGDFDTSYFNYGERDATKQAWGTGGENVALETWYAMDDNAGKSEILGKIYETSSANNAALIEGLNERSMKIIIRNNETHSKNFFSIATTSDIVKYFEQALQYNCGDLSAEGTVALDAADNTWYWRAICNIIAMLSMFGMLLALAGMMFRSKSFEPCVRAVEVKKGASGKVVVLALSIITVILTYIAMFMTNKNGFRLYNPGPFLPLGRTATLTVYFLLSLTVVAVIMLAIKIALSYKATGKIGVVELLAIKPLYILKCVGAAVLLICAAYGALMVIDYLFGQDFRSWMTVFARMKGEYWVIGLRYALIAFPLYVIMGTALNHSLNTEAPEWKEDLIAVIVNSAGIWILCFINIYIAKTAYDRTLFSSFICSYQFNVFVPITVYLARKLYRLTGSVWTGAALNTGLAVWSMMCTLGINDIYNGQWAIGNFLNL